MKPSAGGLFIAISTAAVTVAVALALYLVGPPSEVRAYRLDQDRIAALQNLQGAIDSYRDQHASLPDSLNAALRQSFLSPSQALDPGSDQPFEYRKTAVAGYELCAVFDRASKKNDAIAWRHKTGRSCFAFAVKPRVAGVVVQPSQDTPAD